ncbi:MAG: AMP-binding protein [Myxococcota bacterium]
MYDFVRSWAKLAPDRLAIEEIRSGRVWTYAQLDARAEAIGRALKQELGSAEAHRVALLCKGRGEVFEALFAAAKAKLTLVPLNWRLAARELEGILKDSGVTLLAYDGAHADMAEALLESVPMKAIALDEHGHAGHPVWERLAEGTSGAGALLGPAMEDVPLVLYTSGTTGGPKGVMVPWRQIVFNAINTVLAADLTPEDATLACLPLFHTGGLHALATPTLYRGGRVLLAPSFDPTEATALLRSGRVSTTIAVPTMYEMMAGTGLLEPGPAAIPRILLCGGAPVTTQTLELFHGAGMPLRQGYGLTEVGPNCFTLSPLEGPDRIGTVGFPAFHGEARLVDQDGHEVGVATPGELQLRGPHVSMGYLNRPEATQVVLSEDGWFSTGDVLVRNERGAYAVVGRMKDMFISGGENVYPVEVENALVEHPEVQAAAVLGVQDSKWGQVGYGVLIPESMDAPPNALDLQEWLKHRIARYKVPKHWRFVERFPLNASGKVEKARLLEVVRAELEKAGS